jgi:carbon storage regulator
MLVLSRSPQQSIILQLPNGDHVEVFVADITGQKVKLGIEAPDNIVILRDELFYKDELPEG